MLGNTLYTPTIEGNVPYFSNKVYTEFLEERGITSEEERQEISNILSSGLLDSLNQETYK